MKNYSELVADYSRSFTVPLDLRAFSTKPPCSPPTELVEIEGVSSAEFVSPFTMQTLRIYPGIQCSVAFADAEMLVRQGAAKYRR